MSATIHRNRRHEPHLKTSLERPINAASFEEWVETCLVPTLSKGDIVVMDNLSSHKGLGVEQLIKAAEPNCDICRLIAPT